MPKYLVSSSCCIVTVLSVTGGQTCRFRVKVTCNDLASFTLSFHFLNQDTVCRRRFRACPWTWMPPSGPVTEQLQVGLSWDIHSAFISKHTKTIGTLFFATATRHWAAIGTSSRMPRVPDCQVMTRRHACLTREPWVCFACKKTGMSLLGCHFPLQRYICTTFGRWIHCLWNTVVTIYSTCISIQNCASGWRYIYSRTSNNEHCRGIQILSVIGGVR
jgi:hypothetical protein